MLYPLKFKPLYKERIWGGRELETTFGKKLPSGKVIGESWELSAVAGDVSVVSNGKLKGNNLQELIEIYMGDLVGENVYDRFGDEFPLLIKLIDAQDFLSIQVHPNDELSRQRHNAYGKTEMWYVIDHKPGAELFLGFNQEMTREKYIDYLNRGKLDELLTRYKVSKNSAYFIPAGAIHAIGKGILIAEIQQTSDITYRVFDFNRVDANGKGRELHTELALDAIDYSSGRNYEVTQAPMAGKAIQLESCKYFETNTLLVTGTAERDFSMLDSFVVYLCLDGALRVITESGTEDLVKGETILLPAVIDNVIFEGNGTLLESYIPA
ncbi:MAG: type I phosphomannose isomerase catalytic subunit [Mucinivorans sp.]